MKKLITQEQALAAAAAGNFNPFAQYYMQNKPYFSNNIRRKGTKVEEVDDILQECYIKAQNALPAYKEKKYSLTAFIGRIIQNHIIDTNRKEAGASFGKEGRFTKVYGMFDVDYNTDEFSHNWLDDFEMGQRADVIKKTLNIDDKSWDILKMKYEGIEWTAICEEVGLTRMPAWRKRKLAMEKIVNM